MRLYEIVAQMRQTARMHVESLLDDDVHVDDTILVVAHAHARSLRHYAKMVEDASKCMTCQRAGILPSEVVACYLHSTDFERDRKAEMKKTKAKKRR